LSVVIGWGVEVVQGTVTMRPTAKHIAVIVVGIPVMTKFDSCAPAAADANQTAPVVCDTLFLLKVKLL